MSRFNQIRERRLQSPEFRDQYDRSRRAVAAIQHILQSLESARAEAGMSKVALARRARVDAAAIRRLLTSGSGNPTLSTLLKVANALDLDLCLVPRSDTSARPVDSPPNTMSVRSSKRTAGVRKASA